MFSFLRQSTSPPSTTRLVIDGEEVSIAVKVSARARSFRLSLPAKGPLLTVPEASRWRDAEAFSIATGIGLRRACPARRWPGASSPGWSCPCAG